MDNWHFVHISDIQPGSPRSFRFNPRYLENWYIAREQIIRLKPELMVIGGDITRDGSVHDFEYEEMKDSLDSMHIPYYAIPGNMDTGNKHTDKQGPKPDRDDIGLNVTSEQLGRFSAAILVNFPGRTCIRMCGSADSMQLWRVPTCRKKSTCGGGWKTLGIYRQPGTTS
jgi:hypothetical protein